MVQWAKDHFLLKVMKQFSQDYATIKKAIIDGRYIDNGKTYHLCISKDKALSGLKRSRFCSVLFNTMIYLLIDIFLFSMVINIDLGDIPLVLLSIILISVQIVLIGKYSAGSSKFFYGKLLKSAFKESGN